MTPTEHVDAYKNLYSQPQNAVHLSAADTSLPAAQPVKVPEPAPLFAAQPV